MFEGRGGSIFCRYCCDASGVNRTCVTKSKRPDLQPSEIQNAKVRKSRHLGISARCPDMPTPDTQLICTGLVNMSTFVYDLGYNSGDERQDFYAMSGKIRTEHAGAKNGGGHWGTRAEAKEISRRKRRTADERLERAALGPVSPDGQFYYDYDARAWRRIKPLV
jgi:hypothetical protein